jgi:4-hydroxybenzoyl-CoA reductase subunit beta
MLREQLRALRILTADPMLRLHEYRYHRPERLADALALLREHEDALAIAGGTDLVPNMKHRLFTPRHLVALKGIAELRGIGLADGAGNAVADGSPDARELVIGAGATLTEVSRNPLVRRHFPSLAEAAGKIAAPQIRNSGTMGGNLCLDTRCTYYNQSYFWREALGFCLKKMATSATSPGRQEVRRRPLRRHAPRADDARRLDRPRLRRRRAHAVRSPTSSSPTASRTPCAAATSSSTASASPCRGRAAHRLPQGAAAQLGRLPAPLHRRRPRASRPTAASNRCRWSSRAGRQAARGLGPGQARGAPLREVADAAAALAFKQCHPLENLIVDPDWRHAMVPVYVRRALEEMA